MITIIINIITIIIIIIIIDMSSILGEAYQAIKRRPLKEGDPSTNKTTP